MDYETQRVAQLGIPAVPRWIALDDNSAAMTFIPSILARWSPSSPETDRSEILLRLSRKIFLTRNEWKTPN